MSDEIAIRVDHVSKEFKLPHEKQSSIKGALINLAKAGRGKRTFERQQVLKDISFEIKKGEFFGIVGRNGSGKSTLLKLLAGIYAPTEGNTQVSGKLTPFIELGVGFNPELTGRENVFLNGALLGFNRKQMKAMYDDIVDFAELGQFMDQKLKNYSSGMQVRLAFSIATRVDTSILLIDEVLAVGDAIFQQKCYDYFKELKKRHKTVVFVSHDSGALQQFCDSGVLIEDGKLVTKGSILDVINDYHDILNAREDDQSRRLAINTPGGRRWGTGDIVITELTITDTGGQPQHIFRDSDKHFLVSLTSVAKTECDEPNYGIIITDPAGQQVFASNTNWSKAKTDALKQGDYTVAQWEVPNIFNTGSFKVSPAVSNQAGSIIYDWRDEFGNFKVRKTLQTTALANIAHKVAVSSPKRVKE